MIIHIHHLVHDEQRPFSYLDFMKFEVDGYDFKMTHGTFRNVISRLVHEGLVEVSYKSSITFYTLRGIKFDNIKRMAMTGNHTGVPSYPVSVTLSSSCSPLNPLYRILMDLPLNKSSIHDIRLKFISPQIYTLVSSSVSNKVLGHSCTINSRSKDILFPTYKKGDLLVKAAIHRTDTVSVVVGCSLNPISLDVNGIIRLTNTLSVVEERLSRLVEEIQNIHNFTGISLSRSDDSFPGSNRLSVVIPPHSKWIVTMWHFGADALVEYSGEKFSVTWETAENILIRVYSKVMTDNRARIRLERQEYPNATLADIIEQRLSRGKVYLNS